jgi:hypothetical protein
VTTASTCRDTFVTRGGVVVTIYSPPDTHERATPRHHQPAGAGGPGAALRAAHAPLRDRLADAAPRHPRCDQAQLRLALHRPERTVYRLTEPGRRRFDGWLRELLRTPAKEYTQFAAGLAFAGAVGIEELRALLEERAGRIEAELAQGRAIIEVLAAKGLPRLFMLEGEHAMVLRAAELEWVRGVIAAIAGGSLAFPTPEALAALHESFPDAAPPPAPEPEKETSL